jgi:hypothetical protein
MHAEKRQPSLVCHIDIVSAGGGDDDVAVDRIVAAGIVCRL